MAKKFSELRARMTPEAQARAAARAEGDEARRPHVFAGPDHHAAGEGILVARGVGDVALVEQVVDTQIGLPALADLPADAGVQQAIAGHVAQLGARAALVAGRHLGANASQSPPTTTLRVARQSAESLNTWRGKPARRVPGWKTLGFEAVLKGPKSTPLLW